MSVFDWNIPWGVKGQHANENSNNIYSNLLIYFFNINIKMLSLIYSTTYINWYENKTRIIRPNSITFWMFALTVKVKYLVIM